MALRTLLGLGQHPVASLECSTPFFTPPVSEPAAIYMSIAPILFLTHILSTDLSTGSTTLGLR